MNRKNRDSYKTWCDVMIKKAKASKAVKVDTVPVIFQKYAVKK